MKGVRVVGKKGTVDVPEMQRDMQRDMQKMQLEIMGRNELT